MNHTHLIALHARLDRENERLAMAQTDSERELRTAWIAQIRREIADEMEFLGMPSVPEMDDDELLNELFNPETPTP